MSTAKRELEELRRIREEERIRKQEEAKIQAEKDAIQAKKNAFLARAAMFQQKDKPTDEQVKAEVSKASKERKFARKLNRLLSDDTNTQNPLAMEMGLRGSAGLKYGATHETHERYQIDWEMVEQEGEAPYYWNKVTNETTYERPPEMDDPSLAQHAKPPPPPPPPRRQLPGLGESAPSSSSGPADYAGSAPPPLPSHTPSASAGTGTATGTPGGGYSPWTYVCENEPQPYYWNVETNETALDAPEGYTGHVYSSDSAAAAAAASSSSYTSAAGAYSEDGALASENMWQEIAPGEGGNDINGEYTYTNLASGEVRTEKPTGMKCLLVVDDSTGAEEIWQESVAPAEGVALDGDGGGEIVPGGEMYYTSFSSGVSVSARPNGFSIIIGHQ